MIIKFTTESMRWMVRYQSYWDSYNLWNFMENPAKLPLNIDITA